MGERTVDNRHRLRSNWGFSRFNSFLSNSVNIVSRGKNWFLPRVSLPLTTLLDGNSSNVVVVRSTLLWGTFFVFSYAMYRRKVGK
jgi:hypothetical protein